MTPSWLRFMVARLSVVQRACPWAQPDNLPLFLQLLFGEIYLVVKKSGINLVCQHLMANPKPNIPFQFNHVHQLEQCRQDLCDGLTAVFCYKGSPLHKLNPQVFYKAVTGLSNQLRNTTRQNEYLVGIPINCVVQAFNAVLEDFVGRYVRTKTNATIPFEEFEAGMATALDIKPQQAVMGAYTAVSAPELFIQKQVATFDGSALPAFSGGFTVVPRQGVRSSGSVPPRFAQQHQQPSRKLQRTGPHVSAVGSNSALAVPARPPTLRPTVSPATPAFVTPKPPTVYICVSDFVTKLDDATQFPAGGCTTAARMSPTSHPATSARSVRRRGQDKTAHVDWAYKRYQSNCYGCLSSRPQLRPPRNFPPPPYAILQKFFSHFLTVRRNEFGWISSRRTHLGGVLPWIVF
jgi:hypothetical protein